MQPQPTDMFGDNVLPFDVHRYIVSENRTSLVPSRPGLKQPRMILFSPSLLLFPQQAMRDPNMGQNNASILAWLAWTLTVPDGYFLLIRVDKSGDSCKIVSKSSLSDPALWASLKHTLLSVPVIFPLVTILGIAFY